MITEAVSAKNDTSQIDRNSVNWNNKFREKQIDQNEIERSPHLQIKQDWLETDSRTVQGVF